jgi:hypothetical protein
MNAHEGLHFSLNAIRQESLFVKGVDPSEADATPPKTETIKIDSFAKSRIQSMCHFDRREKSCIFSMLHNKDFSLRSK